MINSSGMRCRFQSPHPVWPTAIFSQPFFRSFLHHFSGSRNREKTATGLILNFNSNYSTATTAKNRIRYALAIATIFLPFSAGLHRYRVLSVFDDGKLQPISRLSPPWIIYTIFHTIRKPVTLAKTANVPVVELRGGSRRKLIATQPPANFNRNTASIEQVEITARFQTWKSRPKFTLNIQSQTSVLSEQSYMPIFSHDSAGIAPHEKKPPDKERLFTVGAT